MHSQHPMTDADRRLADSVAKHVIARLLVMLQDKDTASKIMDVWGGEIDRTIGRGLRRALWYLLLVLAAIASLKIGLLERVLSGLAGK